MGIIAGLWLTAVLTAAYWIDFFFGGAVHSSEDACYFVFEAAFPAADAWMALSAALAAVALHRRREAAIFWGIAAGATLVYLGLMDTLYNLEHGMYARLAGPEPGAMIAESFINLWCLTFGPLVLWHVWSRRRELRS